MTVPKAGLQAELRQALKVHAGSNGLAGQDVSLVLPGGLNRRPDVAFWAVRPSQAQRSHPAAADSLCPPPNMWIEVIINITYILLYALQSVYLNRSVEAKTQM
jgi:hypothetical protein